MNVDIPYIEGEFWTSRQRQCHTIHEISYRACFKPQLPGYFIKRYTYPGDVVYDPFMGRGTTPIEASLMGRIPYGNDLSPLSRVLTEPRINTPSISEIADRLESIDWNGFQDSRNEDLLVFYHPKTLSHLEGLREYLSGRNLDNVDSWIRMVAANRLTGHSPGFFSVYTMPPNQAVSLERQKHLNRKHGQTPAFRNVPELILRKSNALLKQGGISAPNYKFMTHPACATPDIEDGEVSLVVTSPPFLDVVDYKQDNWLRNWFIGANESIDLSIHQNENDWESFVQNVLSELSRVTKKGGYIAFEVGEVKNGKRLLEKNVIKASEGLPLKLEYVLINTQKFTKTSNCWGVRNNTGGTNSNRIVFFERA